MNKGAMEERLAPDGLVEVAVRREAQTFVQAIDTNRLNRILVDLREKT
jgi:hypothetical protein